jgi:hypothetical protein
MHRHPDLRSALVCSKFAESGSIGIAASQQLETGEDEDPQIEPKAPVLDVPKVTIDPLLHQCEMGGLST